MLNLKIAKSSRYLIVGAINTVFGFGINTILYYGFNAFAPTLVILIVANIVSITFSFVTYKLLVFKTKGNWISEYLKCYVVYGASSVIGIGATWVVVDYLHVPFLVTQLIFFLMSAAFSYFAHDRFTFKRIKTLKG